MRLFVVFDTNVIVSAMLSSNPNASTVKVVEAISQGKVIPLYNDEILVEYRNVLHRKKFNLRPSIVTNMIASIIRLGVKVDRTPTDETFVDLSDVAFYEVALSKEGSFVVTGNTRHFPRSPIVVTPAELLAMM
jgi:putative PIN family toxin of toxin-antitoxin system